MVTEAEVLERMQRANPVPSVELLPVAPEEVASLLVSIDRGRTSNMVDTDTRPALDQKPAKKPWYRRPVVAVALGAIAVAAIAIPAVMLSGSDDAVDTETPAAQTTETTSAADVPAADVSAVTALVEQYHAAYNAGDVDGALSLLSSINSVPAGSLEYWVGTLREQVTATCIPSPGAGAAIKCVERYRDALHGPAGEQIRSVFIYTEANGKLAQVHDPSDATFLHTRYDRTTGDTMEFVEGGREVVSSYQAFERDLFQWLASTYPEVAADIGDASQFGYFIGNADATLAAMPYVEEFVADSNIWPRATGRVIPAGMTALEAVRAEHDAFNSHDPVAFEAWFGRPVDAFVEWLWTLGSRYEIECAEATDPATVICTGEMVDDFYTKAGAVFSYTQQWTMVGNELINTQESLDTFEWAFYDFEEDFAAWMREAHPEDADRVFLASSVGDLIHSVEAGELAMSHLDEFLAASDDYPAQPEPVPGVFGGVAEPIFTE